MDHGFSIYELTVISFDKKNNPVDYNQTLVANCIPNSSPCKTRIKNELSENSFELNNNYWKEFRKVKDSLTKHNPNKKIFNSMDTSKLSKKMFNLDRKRDSIIADNFIFKPKKTIYFYKKNINYWWRVNGYISEDLESLPFTFKKRIWYKISFSNQSNYMNYLFFKINEDNSIEKNHIKGYIGDGAW